MQQINENYSDEISLREIIEVLLKGWRLIAIITTICIILSGVFSFLILDPTYEAKSILMANLTKGKSTASDVKTILMTTLEPNKLDTLQNNNKDIADLLDSISAYPTMTIQNYKEQIASDKTLQQVIDEMDLEKYGINRVKLKSMIELETINDTNLISIKVTHKDPKLAADIANTLTKVFTASITEMTRQQASKSSEFLKEQLEAEKKNLDEVTLELKKSLAQSKGADELKKEFDSKLLMLTDFKTQLVESEVELNKTRAGLAASEQELKNTPRLIVTKKSVGQDPLLNQVVADSNGTSIRDAAQIKMESEEVNEGYISLSNKVSEYKIAVSELSAEIEAIRAKIDSTQKELESIQLELADKQHNQNLIQRNVDMAQETYDAFLNKYEEIRVAESTEVGDSIVNIVSQAIIPEEPTGPRKMVNLAIAGILGIMIGVFIVFFKEYWNTSGKQLNISK